MCVLDCAISFSRNGRLIYCIIVIDAIASFLTFVQIIYIAQRRC